MDRLIKYRIWDGKDWREDGIVDMNGTIYELNSGELSSYVKWKSSQFTGMLDKNNKKIYEGDIVKKYDEQIDYTYIGDVTLGTINIENAFGFIYHFMCWKAAEEPIDNTFEVIGNIFENPELLDE